jgi:sodium/hydrogen exchanger 8
VDQRLGYSCYLFGALISAVDPVAVIALFGGTRFRADPVLVSILGGESVLNDAVAIVLFTSVEHNIDQDQPALLTMDVLGHFVLVSFGSFGFGFVAGIIVSWSYRQADYLKLFPHYEIAIMCLTAYLTFALSQFCGLSGIVSLFFYGIVLARYNSDNLSDRSKMASKVAFRTLAMMSEACVFVYLGVVVALALNRFHWNLLLVFASMWLCVLGRAVHIFPISTALNCQRSKKISLNMQLMLWFSGLRGAIAFALSLRIPCNGGPRANRGEDDCQNSDLLVTTTISIVFCTSMICGTSLETVATALGLLEPAPPLTSPNTSPTNRGVDDSEQSPISIVRGHLYQVLTSLDSEVLRPNIGGPSDSRGSREDSEAIDLMPMGPSE